ncbi:hypothetical protein SQ11_12355 [Nitrosospira sp. NpAV]|nr:hypothetical protein SQ11_12355 [Nitrosospira sp. NpAV]
MLKIKLYQHENCYQDRGQRLPEGGENGNIELNKFRWGRTQGFEAAKKRCRRLLPRWIMRMPADLTCNIRLEEGRPSCSMPEPAILTGLG